MDTALIFDLNYLTAAFSFSAIVSDLIKLLDPIRNGFGSKHRPRQKLNNNRIHRIGIFVTQIYYICGIHATA